MGEARGPRLFVSHSSSKRAVAEHVERALAAKGVACWLAPRDVEPGESFARAIPEAIRQTDGVLLLFCSDSVKSRHVERELILADQLGKALIPLRLEKIDPGDLSYHLASSQWLDWLEQRDVVIDRIAARAHQFHQQGPLRPSPPVLGGEAPSGGAGDAADARACAQEPPPQPHQGAHLPPSPPGGSPACAPEPSIGDSRAVPAEFTLPAGRGSKGLWPALAGAVAFCLLALVAWLAVGGGASPGAEEPVAAIVAEPAPDMEQPANAAADGAQPEEQASGEANGQEAKAENAGWH